jgi:hypothetical protein
MQPNRKVRELSGDELEVEMEFQWETLTQTAARWRMLRDEARQRTNRRASEVLAEMVKRRLPPIKRRRFDV